MLNQKELVRSPQAPPRSAEFPAPEHCRKHFSELLRQAAEIAANTGNLFRLVDEYLRAERRARALEHLLQPEIEASVRDILAHPEDADLEEVIPTRLSYKR